MVTETEQATEIRAGMALRRGHTFEAAGEELNGEEREAILDVIRPGGALDTAARASRDVIVPTRDLGMVNPIEGWTTGEEPPPVQARLAVPTVGDTYNGGPLAAKALYPIRALAHEQLGELVGIPRAYYRRMLADAPELLSANVNKWLGEHDKPRRLVRVGPQGVRAVLSDRYRILGNYPLAIEVTDQVQQGGGAVISIEVTEEKFRIRALAGFTVPDEDATRKSGRPQHIRGGVFIDNSEVGRGSLGISPYLYFSICDNGAIVTVDAAGERAGMRTIHVGRTQQIIGILSEETIQAESAAIWGKVRDLVRAAVGDRETFMTLLAALNETKEDRFTAAPVEATLNVCEHYGMSDERTRDVLNAFMAGGDVSLYGLIQAVTATANTVEGADESAELQTLGGQMIGDRRELVRVAVRPRSTSADAVRTRTD